MNMEITKYKNLSDADKMQSRLSRLEELLREIMPFSGNGKKNMQIGDTQEGASLWRQNLDTKGNNKKSLTLSDGQVASQLAATIARANQRNS